MVELTLPRNSKVKKGKRWTASGGAKTVKVEVSNPIVREVLDYEDFTGHTDAISTIEIRARVTGYLDEVRFKEGAEVKKGDVLFVIDQRPYRAALERAEAEVTQSQARSERLQADRGRARNLIGTRAMSREEFAKYIETEIAKWGRVVKEGNIKAQ